MDDNFEATVEADTRSKSTPEEAAYLRQPENWNRWEHTLIDHLNSLDSQLRGREAKVAALAAEVVDEYTRNVWLSATSEYERWKAGALRVKSGVEKRLREVRALRSENENDTENLLIDAIIAHRDFECEETCDKTNGDCLITGTATCLGDQKLWDILETIGATNE